MKAFAILPAAAAAIMALNISFASSQGACQKEYQACMTSARRPIKAIQDTCFTYCEGKNNICAERVYGKRPFNGAPATAAARKARPRTRWPRTRPTSRRRTRTGSRSRAARSSTALSAFDAS